MSEFYSMDDLDPAPDKTTYLVLDFITHPAIIMLNTTSYADAMRVCDCYAQKGKVIAVTQGNVREL